MSNVNNTTNAATANTAVAVANTTAVVQHSIFSVPTQHANVAVQRSITKKQQVINMLATGTTIACIAQTLAISKVAARSLIGDVRHAKIAVVFNNGTYTLQN